MGYSSSFGDIYLIVINLNNMKANYIKYNFDNSLSRIDEILNAADQSYVESCSIPLRDSLTYTNGVYVNCTAVFVDICDSSKLPSVHYRPVLAKIYRSFISEVIAIFNGNKNCREVNVQGDCVWAIFDTPSQAHFRDVLYNCAQVNSLIDILNFKLQKKGYQTFNVGIGADYGRALMIKVGHKGSTINEVVWMGDVVNQASNLCAHGNNTFDNPIVISRAIYKKLLVTQDDRWDEWFVCDSYHACYHGNIVVVYMSDWLQNKI